MTHSAPAQKPRGRRDHVRLCVCMCVTLCLSTQSHFTRIWLRAILWTVARQAPLSMGFPRQEYLSGLLRPPAGNLPDPGIESASLMPPALAGRFFTTSATWEAHILLCISLNSCTMRNQRQGKNSIYSPAPSSVIHQCSPLWWSGHFSPLPIIFSLLSQQLSLSERTVLCSSEKRKAHKLFEGAAQRCWL